MPVELHIADRERWGSVLAIRTGNAEFSHLLVTSRSEGGAMPFRMRQADGGLQRLLEWQEYGPDPEQYAEPRWEAVATPEEADYFTALGLPWIEPFRRNRSVLRRWLLQPSSSPPTTGMCHAGPDQEGK
jgi:DNA polymerase/3'-5' exonuclease PolX